MKNKKESFKCVTGILLAVYLLILTWVILCKMQTDFAQLAKTQYRNINLIPFAGSLIKNGKADISEILMNIAAFVPLGVYLSMLCERWAFWQKVLPVFCVSLAYEVWQYIFGIGASDITDLLGNTFGGVIGIAFYAILAKLFRKCRQGTLYKVLNVIFAVGTVAVVLFLGVLITVNL